jgi:hypothetical protein
MFTVMARTLYHGTSKDHANSIDKYGIWPSAGSFVEEMYGGEIPEEDVPELVFMADKDGLEKAVNAMMFQIYKKLGKRWLNEVTTNDIRNHGALCVIKDVEDGDYEHRSDEDDPSDYREYPSTVEPGDYYSEGTVRVDTILTGPALIRYLRRFGLAIDDDDQKSMTEELTRLAVRLHPDVPVGRVREKIATLKPEELKSMLRRYRDLYRKGGNMNASAALLEEAAARITAGLRETNMIQFLLAEQMGKDFIDWAEEFGQRFRELYDEDQELKQAIDSGKFDRPLLDHVQELLTN